MKQSTNNWVEMAILCNMMVSEELSDVALGELTEDYFRDTRNKVLFNALKSMPQARSGKRFETLNNHLDARDLIEAAGGKAYVTCVYLFVPVGGIDGLMRLLMPKAA